ncbi:MAG TPA: class A beta-lactamase-related serine hydrolase [Flavobacterium sp.]|jgi:beta-lactamase class A|nr:class A beta-lactamase-related serine hydrolase [Flavobacterium sp.]HPJ09478.1 class A beta-lactamase-related serine hydrolase [Flavobacterium sp.]
MNLSITKKTSFIITLISLGITNFATYFYAVSENKKRTAEKALNDSIDAFGNPGCSVKIQRLSGYDYIKPVLFVDQACESDKMSPIKQSVNTLIEEHKRLGTITDASFYLKEYQGNEWTGINVDGKFLPGSLMKVPELICVLKLEEANPGFLNKTLTFNKAYNIDKKPKYLSKSIQMGQSYTVKELLTYMIAYSDNNATTLLFDNIDLSVFKKVFTDMGLQAPDFTAQNHPLSAKDFSIFMRILYNSSYLNEKHSEFATELLGKCNFKDGLVAGLPSSVKVAHKFGESGDPQHSEFSESAIVYLRGNPYVLTVMTKGKTSEQLPGVVKQISETVYQQMEQASKVSL